MYKNNLDKIKMLSSIELLALLSAASSLKKYNYFEAILMMLIERRFSKRKIYETLLQSYLFAGFPSALIALKKFNEIVGKQMDYKGYDLHTYLDRGKKNCRIIYGDKYNNLIRNIKSYSPEMAEWLIVEGYGKVLGRKNLSLKEREICIVSTLVSLQFKEQLVSHFYGALNVGIELSLINKVIWNLKLINCKRISRFGLLHFTKFTAKLHK